MGEVVVSSDEDVNLELKEVEARKNKEEEEDGTTSSVIRWERFLPRMVLRVLLVEADDSTRQIIAALLRKCSYRVAAVPDGLKAWEVLKGKPHNIDLILTEVHLPSISGFALLTLIMEHDICKNIPVIMMSSNDSVSTVYKCMLRGAADFLVKPMRKNELKNLWQHVWRRQASTTGGHGPQDESVAQQMVEATAENNASSNHSSGHMSCIQRKRKCGEKGSDAQSSCTKPDLEVGGECAENMQDPSQLKWSKCPMTEMKGQQQKVCAKSSIKLWMRDCEGFVVPACEDDNVIGREDVAPESQRKHANIINEVCDNNHDLVNSSTEAIDLIGSFDNYPKNSYRSSASIDTNNVDSSPLLDLSLRRSHPNGSVNQISDRRLTLNHSDASAFSRYVNRALQPLQSSASIHNQQKEYERQLSGHNLNYNSNANGLALSSQNNMLSLATGHSGRAEVSQNNMLSQKTPIHVPVPVQSIRFDGLCSADGLVVPTIFCTQSGLSTVQSSDSAHNQGPPFQLNAFDPSKVETNNSQQFHNLVDHNINNSTNQIELKQRHKLESFEDRQYFFSATDQSASKSFGNGTANHLNSIGCVSNGNVDQVAVARPATESRNEESLPMQDRNCHQTVQRAAALTKFRLKRKGRCYEKKVRYESRKKLAEQRPRVKGQFVRQMQTESAPEQTGRHGGNSLDD